MIQAKESLIGKIYEKQSMCGTLNNTVIHEYPELEDLEATPSKEKQNFKSSKYGYDEVTIKAVTSDIDKNIQPENIKEGTTILGIAGSYKGVDTSDATVDPSHILVGQTAYVNGEKIEGTMPNNGTLSFTPTDNQQIIPSGYTEGGYIEPANIETLQDYNTCLSITNEILGEGV